MDGIDSIKPWTIKAVATETRDLAIVAARREGLTVGQWLEKVIRRATSDQSGPSPPAAVGLSSIPGLNIAVELVNLAGQPGITKENRNRANRLAGMILQGALVSAASALLAAPKEETPAQIDESTPLHRIDAVS